MLKPSRAVGTPDERQPPAQDRWTSVAPSLTSRSGAREDRFVVAFAVLALFVPNAQSMPRDKGIGKKRKRHVAPLAEVTVNVPEHETEQEPALEPESEQTIDDEWLRNLLLDVAMGAVDVQRRVDGRFRKYAATATACRVAWESAERGRNGRCPWNISDVDYLSAHVQALAELESCLDWPYDALPRKYRCVKCGQSIVACECEEECACGRDLPIRSWRIPNWWALCRCGEARSESEDSW